MLPTLVGNADATPPPEPEATQPGYPAFSRQADICRLAIKEMLDVLGIAPDEALQITVSPGFAIFEYIGKPTPERGEMDTCFSVVAL